MSSKKKERMKLFRKTLLPSSFKIIGANQILPASSFMRNESDVQQLGNSAHKKYKSLP